MGRDALEAIDDTVGVQLPLMGRIMKDYSKSAPRTPGTLSRVLKMEQPGWDLKFRQNIENAKRSHRVLFAVIFGSFRRRRTSLSS